jgi:hypothetical protein
VPTSFGGHGGPPYGPKHLKFHMSAASGLNSGQFNRKRNFEKANIEYRISNKE